MDNFIFLTYAETRVVLDCLKKHLLTDIQEEEYETDDYQYLLSALLKLQRSVDSREK